MWDILDPRFNYTFLEQCTHWKAHTKRITSIDYVENPRILDTFLLTACQDGTVSCWTLNGAHVGQFGQGAAWNLDNETSFRSSSPEPLEHEHSAEYDSELDSESDTEYPEEVYSEYSLDEG